MSRRNDRRWILALAVALTLTSGCARTKERVKSWSGDVQGRVRLDGKPMPGGTITFLPDQSAGDEIRPGVGRIDRDGTYRIGNSNTVEPTGVRPGEYKVTVMRMRAVGGGAGHPLAQLDSPEIYTDLAKTPLRATVRAGRNQVDFDLTSAD